MNNLLKLITASLIATSLTGCVIAVGNDHDKFDEDGSNWKKTQKFNQGYINQLSVGADVSSVRNTLGVPAFTESLTKNGEVIDIFFYRTHHTHSDGTTSKDECTALIFKKGLLVGWGDKAYQNL